MTTILPGLRDLRAPLASGFLWLAVLSVVLTEKFGQLTQPKSGVALDLWHNIIAVNRVEGFAQLSALGFVAYLIGVASCSTGPALGVIVSFVVDLFPEWPQVQPFNSPVEALVQRSLVHRYDVDPPFAQALIEHADLETFMATKQSQVVGMWSFSDSIRGRRSDPFDLLSEEELRLRYVEWRAVLPTLLRLDPLTRFQVIRAAVDITQYSREVSSAVRLLPNVLDAKADRIFDRWDRLRSEGEFRSAVAAPFIGAALPVWRIWGYGPVFWIPILVGIAFLGIGQLKYREADQALLGALESSDEAEIGSLPVVSKLKVGPIYWRVAHISESSDSWSI